MQESLDVFNYAFRENVLGWMKRSVFLLSSVEE